MVVGQQTRFHVGPLGRVAITSSTPMTPELLMDLDPSQTSLWDGVVRSHLEYCLLAVAEGDLENMLPPAFNGARLRPGASPRSIQVPVDINALIRHHRLPRIALSEIELLEVSRAVEARLCYRNPWAISTFRGAPRPNDVSFALLVRYPVTFGGAYPPTPLEVMDNGDLAVPSSYFGYSVGDQDMFVGVQLNYQQGERHERQRRGMSHAHVESYMDQIAWVIAQDLEGRIPSMIDQQAEEGLVVGEYRDPSRTPSSTYFAPGAVQFQSQDGWVDLPSRDSGFLIPRQQQEDLLGRAEFRRRRRELQEAEEAERLEAKRRGTELLESFLADHQLEEWHEHGWFTCVGGKTGNTYRVRKAMQINVDELDDDGEVFRRLCAVPTRAVTVEDHMLAMKFLIESRESYYLQIAEEHLPPGLWGAGATSSVRAFGGSGSAVVNGLGLDINRPRLDDDYDDD